MSTIGVEGSLAATPAANRGLNSRSPYTNPNPKSTPNSNPYPKPILNPNPNPNPNYTFNFNPKRTFSSLLCPINCTVAYFGILFCLLTITSTASVPRTSFEKCEGNVVILDYYQ